jgi:hypothetical protein
MCHKRIKEVKTYTVVAEPAASTPLVLKPATEHELEPVLFASELHHFFHKTRLNIILPSVLSYTYTFFKWVFVSCVCISCLTHPSRMSSPSQSPRFHCQSASEGMYRGSDSSNRPPFPDSTNCMNCILQNSKVHYHIHKSPPRIPVLSEIYPSPRSPSLFL